MEHPVSPKVLVADDDDSLRTVITAVLEKEGFSAITVSDGEPAVSIFTHQRPDLVLLDVDMPGMGGFRACQEIRSQPEGESVPIVLVTGHDDTDSIERAYQAGATDFISKPVNWPLLGHRLRYIMRGALNLQALRESEAENRALLEAIPDRIFVVGRNGLIHQHLARARCNETPQQNLVGRRISDFMPARASERVLRTIDAALSSGENQCFEYLCSQPMGEKRHYEARYVPHGNGTVLAIIRDITERKQAEERIHRLAFYDTLTGLPNRQWFLNRLQEVALECDATGTHAAVIKIDLDRFKRINDTLGHDAGDVLLRAIAERLDTCARDVESTLLRQQRSATLDVARLEGDQFAVVFTGDPAESDAVSFAHTIKDALAAPLRYGKHEYVLTPSIGIAFFPRDGREVVDLLKNADRATNEAKKAGRNGHMVYARVMRSRSMDRLTLEEDLRKALKRDEFCVYFQPKHDAVSREIAGAEALLRWFHPRRGEISPSVFIPLAEEAGLIMDIDRWVMAAVCEQIRAWRSFGLQCPRIAVNLSGQEFCHGNLYSLLEGLEKYGVGPEALELEVTESVLMRDVGVARRSLTALKELGFKIAVDDFGTGYSSLTYLKQFPLDVVKIDRSFVQDLDKDADASAICRAIITMSHGLGLRVVAEGVETEGQAETLQVEGCDQLQGHLLSSALPADEFGELISDGKAAGTVATSGLRVLRPCKLERTPVRLAAVGSR